MTVTSHRSEPLEKIISTVTCSCLSLRRDPQSLVEKQAKISTLYYHTDIHDDGLSPSVMKALAAESRRHRGTAFLSSPCASVAIFFHGKHKTLVL